MRIVAANKKRKTSAGATTAKVSSKAKASSRAKASSKAKASSPLSAKAGSLSIWAGHFDSLDELEAHIDAGELEEQHGFVIEPPLLPFNAFLEEASPEALVRSILEDDQRVAKVAAAIGDEPTNALLLYEDFAFDASLVPRGSKRMRFLGTWPKPKTR